MKFSAKTRSEAMTPRSAFSSRPNWDMVSVVLFGIGIMMAGVTHDALGGGSYYFLVGGIVSGLALYAARRFSWVKVLLVLGGAVIAATATALIVSIE